MMRNFILSFFLVVGIVLTSPLTYARQYGYERSEECKDNREVLAVIDDVDTITVGEFERAYGKNCIGQAQAMSQHDFLDEFLTFRLNIAEAKVACIDTLPEYWLAVSTHMMTLIHRGLPPHLAALITSNDDDVVADVVAAADSVYNARSDIREAVGEYGDYLLTAHIIEDYLDKAGVNNPDSLSRFFEETRQDYVWDEPRFKGYVICVARSENPDEVNVILEKTGVDMNAAIPMLRAAYGRNIRIGHVVLPRGVNPIVDYVGFGGERTEEVDAWSLCKAIDGRLIDAPESYEDVGGTVSDRYRTRLLKRRYDRLRGTHNVKINQNALKKIESLTGDGANTSSAQNK